MIVTFQAQMPSISYPILIQSDPPADLIENFTHFFVITDSNARRHIPKYARTAEVLEVPCGEPAKSLRIAETIYRRLVEAKVARRSYLVLGVGGGAVCDLAGYVAMTYMRGIPYALVPTTLLAMTDAAIGAKVAVNSPEGSKNLVGGFHAPAYVQVNLDALSTLPQREYLSAFGEVIKVACIANDAGRFFRYLTQNAQSLCQRSADALLTTISRAVEVKMQYVEADLLELNLDRLLNLGHALAHSIETVSDFSLLHGECVAIGVVQAAKLGLQRGLTSYSFFRSLVDLTVAFGLPTQIPGGLAYSRLEEELSIMRSVRGGDLREVIPVEPGESIIVRNLSVTDILNAHQPPLF